MTTAPVMSITDELLAELYQILGAHGASEKVLDQVQAAISGEPLPHASLLPYEAPAAQEPVATLTVYAEGSCKLIDFDGAKAAFALPEGDHPLYTAPPAAEQPDTVKVPRELLERVCADSEHAEMMVLDRGKAIDELRALLGKEGEA